MLHHKAGTTIQVVNKSIIIAIPLIIEGLDVGGGGGSGIQ